MSETATLILFLRAVNLGATNKVPMKRLMDVLKAESVGQPSYLLQSGNVIISNSETGKVELLRLTERLILEEFGVDTVAIGRTPEQLAGVARTNPYTAPEGGSVHVALWDLDVADDVLTALANESFGEDQLTLIGSEAYMRYQGGSHGSKLGNSLLERRLKIPTTARNMNTVHRLLAVEQVATAIG